jgi:perosamine synthetase
MEKKIKIPLSKPWLTEKESMVVSRVVRSKWLISGPEVREFEDLFAKKIGTKHAIAVNSGSSALLIAQAAIGVSEGNEVIVPDMTFVSTASSSIYLGAKPVFCDIDLLTYCLNPKEIEKKITRKTKAIIPVHYAGQTAEMLPILELAKKYKLYVIEDAAEAHLSEYNGKKAGAIGHMAIFSFTPSKPMTTGEGGMITTNDDKLANCARLIRDFGDTDKFHWDLLGFNFRMPEIMGAIGKIQLKRLDKAIKIRREIAAEYNEAFSRNNDTIITPFVRDNKSHNFQLYTIRLNLNKLTISRDAFIKKLAEKGISSRLYYPSLHNQKVFSNICNQKDSEFPNTLEFTKTALSLSIYPELTKNDIQYIVKTVNDLTSKFRR